MASWCATPDFFKASAAVSADASSLKIAKTTVLFAMDILLSHGAKRDNRPGQQTGSEWGQAANTLRTSLGEPIPSGLHPLRMNGVLVVCIQAACHVRARTDGKLWSPTGAGQQR